MICQEVMELMQRYIDGDLDQQETSLMMGHAGQCPDCAAMLVRLQKLSSELEQLPRVVPRFSLVDAILPELERLHAADSVGGSRMNGEESETKSLTSRSQRPSRHLFRKISGVVAAGVIVGLLLFNGPEQWTFTGGSSHNDAASLNELSAPAAQEDASKLKVMFNNEQEVSKSSGAQEKRQAASEKMDEKSTLYSESLSGSGESDSQPNEEAAPEITDQTQVTATSGGGTSSTENPSADSSVNSPMSITKIPATASVSPDGKWRAIAVEGAGSLQVYNTADESELFRSEVRDGTISLLSWNEDSTVLYYTFTDNEGRQSQMQFDVINVSESMR